MNLEYFQEFIELARRLNFTETAQHLHITQSTLSKHISLLEKEVGTKLLVRQHDGAQLTEEGYVFFGGATSIVDIFEETLRKLRAMGSQDAVRIDGQLRDPGVSGLISTAIAISSDSGCAPIRFNRTQTKAPLDLLADDDVDLLIMGETPERIVEWDFECCCLLESRFVAVVEQSHPLAARQSVSISDMRNETFVRFLDEYSRPGWRSIEAACRSHGFEPRCRPVLAQSVAEQLATPLNGCVLIFPRTSKELRFLEGSTRRVCIPVSDDDAAFRTYGIYKREKKERVTPFLKALEKAREIMGEA